MPPLGWYDGDGDMIGSSIETGEDEGVLVGVLVGSIETEGIFVGWVEMEGD